MKTLNGIISVLLGLASMYLMFFKAQTDQDIIYGFGVLLMSIIFKRLRHIIMKSKGMI